MADVYTNLLPSVSSVDELLGNKTTDGVTQTVRIARSLITTGASEADVNAVADRATALESDIASGAKSNKAGASIASASTTNLASATGEVVSITGTTTITALGTVAAGIQRVLVFAGALTLTHNATSLILPGGANITTAAGDVAIMRSLGSGNWRCVDYIPAAVKPGLASNTQADSRATDIAASPYQVGRIVDTAIATATDTIKVLSGTSWDRPDVPPGQSAYFQDNSLLEMLRWERDHWVEDISGDARPTPGYVLDDLSVMPVYAFSLTRRLSASYAGPLGKAQRTSDGATYAYYSVDEIERNLPGANRIISRYQQADNPGSSLARGAEVAIVSGTLEIVYDRGYIFARNTSSTTSATLRELSSADRALFNGAAGCTGMMVMRSPMPYVSYLSSGNWPLINISTASAGNARWSLRMQSSGYVDIVGRRLDADSARITSFDRTFGGLRSLGFRINNGTAVADMLLNGGIERTDASWQTAGNVSATTPAAGAIYVHPSSEYTEDFLFAASLSDDDLAIQQADQIAAYGARYTMPNQCQSWWTHVASQRGGKTTIGFSTFAGLDGGRFVPISGVAGPGTSTQGVVQIDNKTHKVLTRKSLLSGVYINDDHDSIATHHPYDGSLVVSIISHSEDNKVRFYYSATGDADDLGSEVLKTSLDGDLNYGSFFESRKKLFFLTGSDGSRGWLLFVSDGKDINDFVPCRMFARQQTAPGGGQNQMYVLGSQPSSERLRMFPIPHPTNVQNKIYIAEIDCNTGDMTTDGSTVIGNALASQTVTGASLVDIPSLSAIYTPPSNMSVRLLGCNEEGTLLTCVRFTTATEDDGMHFILVLEGANQYSAGSWVAYDVGASGLPFAANYFPGMVPAREPHGDSIRLYRTRQETDGSESYWYLEQCDSANGGLTWQFTPLYDTVALNDAGSTVYKMPRPFAPKNADPDCAVIALMGSYTSFVENRLAMLPFATSPVRRA